MDDVDLEEEEEGDMMEDIEVMGPLHSGSSSNFSSQGVQ